MHINDFLEIMNVFIAYFVLIVLVSSYIIKPLVKDKNIINRFIMYVVFGNFYLMMLVFILSYLRFFNRLSLIISLLVSAFAIRIMLDKKGFINNLKENRKILKHLISGEYGFKLFFYRYISYKLNIIRNFLKQLFWGKRIEWIIFLLIISYNLYYYNYSNMNFMSFGAPDEEVHLYWIQSLISGRIFPSGVYPHGFHNVISAISVVFGLKAVIVTNAFSFVSTVLIMTMLYLGLRKILLSKYAALLGFAVYSLINIYRIESLYRYQFSIPQEYGMIMLMPMVLFLFSYLRKKQIIDLVFFGICFVMTISIHFYISIIALILALSVSIIYFYRIIKKKLLIKLIICGILSGLIAIAPLGVGVALGNELEQSMDWAVRVIQGRENNKKDEKTKDDNKDNRQTRFDDFVINSKKEITKYVFFDIRVMYIFLALIVLTIVYCIFSILIRKKLEENLYQLVFAMNGLLLIFLMLCRSLNLPTVMEAKRVAIFFSYFSPFLIAMPFEILYRLFVNSKLKRFISCLTVLSMVTIIIIIIDFGLLRPLLPFYYFQTKGAMLVDCNIMKKYNDFEWTIVAPVNDISVVMNNGYHYELSDFILNQENWNEDIKINIPTKYVFIYVEKRPIISYGSAFYKDDKEIVNREIVTYEDAEKTLLKGKKNNEYYKKDRRILMSKAYYWAKEYQKYFPTEMSVYYEDDEIIVYRIVQNIYALNNFAINYEVNK
ncbi:MAG: hypothetical protein N4A63_03510 [Vallitalea sp.]|nr:hypothetical protein [Vallitalea sp.]